MAREPTERARERPYAEVFRQIEERIGRRQAELAEIPHRRLHELPEVQVEKKAKQLAEKLADALSKGVKALDRW